MQSSRTGKSQNERWEGGREGGRNKEKNITLNGNQTHTCIGEKMQCIDCPHSEKCVTVRHVCECVWFEECVVASSAAVTQVNRTAHLYGTPTQTHTHSTTARRCPLTAPYTHAHTLRNMCWLKLTHTNTNLPCTLEALTILTQIHTQTHTHTSSGILLTC